MTPADHTCHRSGVRRILNNAAHRALATRHAEAWYVATVLATATGQAGLPR